ncbi:hypothetical protein ISS03_01570 [Patescibacteria group bacterium]|nr:hypothetical protein [Patescibacteria group bacterium]
MLKQSEIFSPENIENKNKLGAERKLKKMSTKAEDRDADEFLEREKQDELQLAEVRENFSNTAEEAQESRMSYSELDEKLQITTAETEEAKERYVKIDPILNERPEFDRENPPEEIYGHGTNAHALWSSLTTTNFQLVPHELRDQLNIPTLTGESQGGRELNRKYISVVGLYTSSSSFHDLKKYADQSSSSEYFAVTPINIDQKIEKLQYLIDQFQKMIQQGTLASDNDVVANLPHRMADLHRVKGEFDNMDKTKKEIITELSLIPIIIVGDRSRKNKNNEKDELYNVNSSISNEIGITRLNARVVATDNKNMQKVKLLLDKLGSTDIKLITFDDLNQYNSGNIKNLFKNKQ